MGDGDTGSGLPYKYKSQTQDTTEYYDYGEDLPKNCSVSESIAGGWVSYSEEGAEGSVLTYHCAVGHYAYPISTRVCSDTGEWSAMRLANGRQVAQATCKEVQCPAQLQLDNGELWPRQQWFRAGEVQEFSCQDGFTLRGSAVRNCTMWGAWTGSTPVCDDQADDCSNPGTPPGALRTGDRFRVGEKVQYRCQTGLDLLGSSERVCLESREWSGSEARCQAPFTFDSPDSAARAIAGSLSGVMDVSSPEFKKRVSFMRNFRFGEDQSHLNIYILLDTSGSIRKQDFQKAKDTTAALISKLDSYDVNMKFQVISYAAEPKEIMNIASPWSNSVEHVLQALSKFNHTVHGKKTGTNLHAALDMVYKRMAFLKEQKDGRFNETQNVILITTDGHSNTGRSPKAVLAKIRSLMGYNISTPGKSKDLQDHTAENLLDIYVFGVGQNVNKKELNTLTSKKQGEKHIFILKKYKDLGEVFDKMISDSAVTMCGIAQEAANRNPSKDYTRPWHVHIESTSSGTAQKCKGSIVTGNWVLTAAHCFKREAVADPGSVKVVHGMREEKFASSVILHPQYNVAGLKHKKVNEFYDYDVALIKLNQSIKLSGEARPICLPCTKPANRALKMDPTSSCDQHEKAVFHLEETPAFFLTEKLLTRKETHVQRGSKRADCIKHAAVTFKPETTASLAEVVTDRFLCTGGSRDYKDAIACKGDSGGALFLRKKHRYFQVAVVSWGNRDMCSAGDSPPGDARDFHISIFSVLSWLKEHLSPDLEFLPATS
ncbi:complement C2 isoform X2 [Anguilla anguilla]|uniref:complement C2 isoform X2 n=1 Tax=Anguilla anguilla TaxID=7936 RepID=UPI0015AB1C71|nr:complement C2 isoform X2 [Anguilla anguilla]